MKQLRSASDPRPDGLEELKPMANKKLASHKTVSAQAKELLFTNFLIDSIRDMFSLEEEDLNVGSRKVEPKDEASPVPLDHKMLSFQLDNNNEVEIDITSREVVKCELDSVRGMLTRLLGANDDIGL